ncbi:MAG: uroporphyrinogen-III C-methyltransferase [Nitrospirales bacterium]|nr:uroporphyrinogen-III C-methyltransferase [Nitrospirales bacterium]
MIDVDSPHGYVFLVGAGPGDVKLLTLRGKECLEQADVILYDHLANPELLKHAPQGAERIYVGRKGRKAYQDQAEINALLITKAREGKRVVRLKGGDPFVFGRGGEEAEWVAQAGIPFEVVPGVTAAVAVPAYAGIPVTHRTLASTVAFITGHEDPEKPVSAMEWPRFASAEGTLVFLMGMKNLPQIIERLIKEGKQPSTPIALIQWGTYARQRTVVGTLHDIVAKAVAAGITPPTVIVVGEVVRLRDRLNWCESRPLFGKAVLVTRPRVQAPIMSNLLAGLGAEPVECPTLEICPPDSWEAVDRAIHQLSTYHWVIFTSVNGVQSFMTRLQESQKDARSFGGIRICCIGPKTKEELAKWGLTADMVPKDFQAEGILSALGDLGISGKRILIPRAKVAREILPEQLQTMGAEVDVVTTYQALPSVLDVDRIRQRLAHREIQYLTFTSSSTVRNFCNLFPNRQELASLVEDTIVSCIGPITAQTVEEEGLTVDIIASENTVASLVQAIVAHADGTRPHAA